MHTLTHRIGERVRLIHEADSVPVMVRIRRMADGFYLNFTSSTFVDTFSSACETEMSPLFDTDLVHLQLATFPRVSGEFLVEYIGSATTYELHTFGSVQMIYEPARCLIFGTLRDVSGAPVSGQRVEAVLNRGGYFPHKSGLIGEASSTITDDSGYFELALVPGLDIVISIPSVGFSQRGIVPPVSSIELSSNALLARN